MNLEFLEKEGRKDEMVWIERNDYSATKPKRKA